MRRLPDEPAHFDDARRVAGERRRLSREGQPHHRLPTIIGLAKSTQVPYPQVRADARRHGPLWW